MHENRDFMSSFLNILCVYERMYKSVHNKHDTKLNICFMYHVCVKNDGDSVNKDIKQSINDL